MKQTVIEIMKARYCGDYKIELAFSDGEKRLVNFRPFLKKAKNPMTTQYLKPGKFKNFKVKYGDLVWGDYEMCFPIWDLYKGKIN